MSRKSGSPRQQSIFKCYECNITFKKNANYVFHMKEEHDIEK